MREIYYDELTGCYNRRFLHYWVENEIKRATRFATKFAILLLDLDDFRTINNNFGHLEGDRALVEFSRFLRHNVREVDNLIRYGGDEFIILMPNTNEKGAVDLAQRIIESINVTEVAGHKIHCSIGFAVFPDDGTAAEALISQADALMYQAKQQGKNTIGWKQKAIRKLQIPSPIAIGRNDEAQWCLSQLKDYRTLFIAGEAGIGKTRLVYEIRDRLRSTYMLRGNAYAALASVPYHPFKNLFNELIAGQYDLVQRVFKLMPEAYQAEIAKIVPAHDVARVAAGEALDKYRLYNSVSEFIQKLSELQPTELAVMLVDDVHWLDRPSCELLDFLIRSAKDNVRVFCTYRVEEIKHTPVNEFLGVWAREKLYTQIMLAPLNEQQSTQLLRAIVGVIPQAAVKFIFKQSGGNPFYIEEILRELERQKKLYWNGKEWCVARTIEIPVPTSIEETILRKLTFLDDELKSFLDIAAVYGHEFNAEVIAMTSKRNVGQINDALDELQRLGFVKERTREMFFFSEDIVRQIIYRNISRRHLIQFHKAVGETIEIMYRNVLPNYFEQLATHFTFANDIPRALHYSREAARKAKENYAHSVAIKFYENALKYEDSIDEIFNIKYALADIYATIGDYQQALQQLQTCIKINPNAYKIYERIGKVYENMGEYRQSRRYYNTGLKLTQGSDAVYTFKSDIAWLNTRLGQYGQAKRDCDEIIKRKHRVARQSLSDTYIILGVVNLRLGKLDQAEANFKKALKIRKKIGDKQRIAACFLDLAISYQDRYNVKMSEKFNKKALEMYEEIGYQSGILLTLNNLGVLYASLDLPRAEEYYLRALKQAKLIGAKRTIVYLHNNLAAIELGRLMYDDALISYKQSLKLSKEMKFHEGVVFSNIGLSEYYRSRNKMKKGRAHLEKAYSTARKMNMKYFNIDCMKEEIEYLLQAGKTKQARALSDRMSKLLVAERNISYRIDNLIYHGKVSVAMKKYTQAHRNYQKAFNHMKKMPPNKTKGEIHFLRGIAYKKEGRFKLALKLFIEANKIFEEIGDLRFLDRIEHEIAHANM